MAACRGLLIGEKEQKKKTVPRRPRSICRRGGREKSGRATRCDCPEKTRPTGRQQRDPSTAPAKNNCNAAWIGSFATLNRLRSEFWRGETAPRECKAN